MRGRARGHVLCHTHMFHTHNLDEGGGHVLCHTHMSYTHILNEGGGGAMAGSVFAIARVDVNRKEMTVR